MKAVKRLSRSERRGRLLESAEGKFGASGYRRTEVADIARGAGVTKPMLYRHFPGGKTEIFLAVLEGHLNSLVRRLWEAMASSKHPRDRLYLGVDAYLRFAEEDPEGFRLMTDSSPELDSEVGRRLSEARNVIAGGMTNTLSDVMGGLGLDAQGAPIYAYALLGAVESVAQWWLEVKAPDREQLVDYILAFVWRGFDGLPRDPTKFHLLIDQSRARPPARKV